VSSRRAQLVLVAASDMDAPQSAERTISSDERVQDMLHTCTTAGVAEEIKVTAVARPADPGLSFAP